MAGVRQYRAADLERLQEIHARQGFDYPMPNPADRNFLAKLVVEEDGKVEMGALARLTTELYLFVEPGGDARKKWAQLQSLQRAMETELYEKGADDMHAFVPPEICKQFERRLTRRMGFARDDRYIPFVKYLDAVQLGPRVEA